MLVPEKSQKLARKATVGFDLNMTAINGNSKTVAPVGGGDGTLIYIHIYIYIYIYKLYGYAI